MSLQKLPDKWRGGFFTDLVGRPDLFDSAGIHDHNAVGYLNRFILIVGDKEGGNLELALELLDPAPEFFADHRIQSAEWFVQQENYAVRSQVRVPRLLAGVARRTIARADDFRIRPS